MEQAGISERRRSPIGIAGPLRRTAFVAIAVLAFGLAVTPAAAAGPPDCALRLAVERVHATGDPVVIHISGLTGVGGIDIFISWRNRTDEFHLFLVPGITEFDFVYPMTVPGEEPPPALDPGRYRVHATDVACEVRTGFRVSRSS
jgi:hypothetical protein